MNSIWRDADLDWLLRPLAGGQPGPSPLFALTGDIADPSLYCFDTLAGLQPVTTETASYTAGGTPVTDTYTGITLWNLLDDAGGVTTTNAKNDILSKFVVATGSDGYTAVYSLGEIDPKFGNQPDLVAYSDTGGQLGPGGADGFARMVEPGDAAGGRYVSNIVNLRVGGVAAAEPGPAGISDQFTLSGTVAHPDTYTAITLQALNQGTTQTATYTSGTGQVTDTYTGVPLWTLVNDAGLLIDPTIKNDVLRDIVVATGSDGYWAVFSLGEIDPAFGNQPDLVAYADTQGQLGAGGADGFARLVVPGDLAGGRYVSNLTSLQVINTSSLHQTPIDRF